MKKFTMLVAVAALAATFAAPKLCLRRGQRHRHGRPQHARQQDHRCDQIYNDKGEHWLGDRRAGEEHGDRAHRDPVRR